MRRLRPVTGAALLAAAAAMAAMAAEMVLAAVAGGATGVPAARAANNGVERTPELGWSSWSFIRNKPTAAKMEAQASALHYDSIEIGNGSNDGLTLSERQVQLSLWSLGASPLILGVDLTHLDTTDLGYLKNAAVLAVDRDSIAASRVVNTTTAQVFTKKEPAGGLPIG